MSNSRREDGPGHYAGQPQPLSDADIEQAARGGSSTSAHGAELAPAAESLAWIWQRANQQIEQLKVELKLEQQRHQVLAQRKAQQEAELAALRQQLDASRAELEQSQVARRHSERELASLQAGWKHLQQEYSKLENERAVRLKIERRLALLDTQSDKALELAGQLAKERNLRLKLEREKGMLLNEVKSRREVEAHLQALTEENTALRDQLLEKSPRAAQLDLALRHVSRLEKMLAEEKTVRLSSDVRAANVLAKLSRMEGEMAARRRPAVPVRKTEPARHWLSKLLLG